MEIDLLYEKFRNANSVEEISECIYEAFKLFKVYKDLPMTETSYKLALILQGANIFFYQIMKLVDEKNVKLAEDYAYVMTEAMMPIHSSRFVMWYVLARVKYIAGDYERAARLFFQQDACRTENWNDVDELSYFYRANSLAMLGLYDDAAEIYEKILQIKAEFPEVKNNLELVKNHTNENLTLDVSSLWNMPDWRDVPIFINARDRLGVMKRLIDWLLDAGHRNIVILDNKSTYKELLKYYAEVETDSRFRVIRFKKNWGYKSIWQSNILEELKISTPYVYTDPDVLPVEDCPKDLVQRLWKILDSNHEIRKVGPSLVWKDITISSKARQQEIEERMFRQGYLGNNLSYANIDTTFALYANLRCYSLRFSLRTYGNIRCRHLPWYFDYKHLPADEKYYLKHADRSSVTTVQDKVLNKDNSPIPEIGG